MLTPIRFLIDHHDRHIVVRLIGVLDGRAAPVVRRLLLECLAEGPDALLVDLGGVEKAEPAATPALVDVAEQAALWPDIPVVVHPAVRLPPLPASHRLLLVGGAEQAAARVRTGRVRPSLREDLLPVVGAARRGRELTAEAFLSWDLAESCLGPACLVATELITNASVHAGTMMTLSLTLAERHLQITVRDGSDDLPARRAVPPLAPVPGRGLLLVEGVAARWGALPSAGGGKVVWSVLDVPAGGGPPGGGEPADGEVKP